MFEGLREICEIHYDDGYGPDETPKTIAPKPAEFVVVKPRNSKEVAEILRFANKRRIPVFFRGGGTGLSGGAVPTVKGIVLSSEKMKEIEIDKKNKVAICSAGVTLEELSKAAEKAGLSFPPHPGAETATVGGMIATNAGGVRALKYGTIRSYVLGLEVVLADGRILKLGGKMLKNSTDSSLLHLIVGSEGMLAFISKAILRLLPPLKEATTLAIPFPALEDALEFSYEVSSQFIPLALEFMEKRAVEFGEKISGTRWVSKDGEAHVLAIFERREEAEKAAEIAIEKGAIDVFIASPKEAKHLLELRSKLYFALKDRIIEILDACVPPVNIGEYIRQSTKLAEEYKIDLITYGHLGDGNVHQHPLIFDGWGKVYYEFRKKLLKLAVELGGVISGEHGIGAVKMEEFKQMYPIHYEILKALKLVFDPNQILNPKIF